MIPEVKKFNLLTNDPLLLARMLFLMNRCGSIYLMGDKSIHGIERTTKDEYTDAHQKLQGSDFFGVVGLYPLGAALGVAYDNGVFSIHDVPVIEFNHTFASPTDVAYVSAERFPKHVILNLKVDDNAIAEDVRLYYKAMVTMGAIFDHNYGYLIAENNSNDLAGDRVREMTRLTQENAIVLRRKGSADANVPVGKVNAVLATSKVHVLRDDGVNYVFNLSGTKEIVIGFDTFVQLGLAVF